MIVSGLTAVACRRSASSERLVARRYVEHGRQGTRVRRRRANRRRRQARSGPESARAAPDPRRGSRAPATASCLGSLAVDRAAVNAIGFETWRVCRFVKECLLMYHRSREPSARTGRCHRFGCRVGTSGNGEDGADRRRQRAQYEALQRSPGGAWLRHLQTRNGIEAIELAREHRPDLILMDIQLPEVSGLEVTSGSRTTTSCARSRSSPSRPSP